jgi:hypothetical protein
LRQTNRFLEHGLGMPEECGLEEWKSFMSVDCQLGRL